MKPVIHKLEFIPVFYIKIYVFASIGLYIIIAGLGAYLTLSKALDSKRLIDSQIEYQEALTSQVGKPQVVETRYITK